MSGFNNISLVPGLGVRVMFLERVRTASRATTGCRVFAHDRVTDIWHWQTGVVVGLGSRLATLRRPSGDIDERVPGRRQSLHAFTAGGCVWASEKGWSATDRAALKKITYSGAYLCPKSA